VLEEKSALFEHIVAGLAHVNPELGLLGLEGDSLEGGAGVLMVLPDVKLHFLLPPRLEVAF